MSDPRGRDGDIERAMPVDTPWEALARYGRGDLAGPDVAALHAWAGTDDARQVLLAGVRRLGELAQSAPGGGRADAAWARVRGQLAFDDVGPAVLRLEPAQASAPAPEVAPAPAAAETRVGDLGRRGRWFRRVVVAGLAAASVALAVVVADRWRRAETVAQFHEVIAPRGRRTAVRLPDGTRATLGPESRIRYAMDHDARLRLVYVEGSAYFDVAHDSVHPFIVRGRGGEAQAVGTSFGVHAFAKDSTFEVAVVEGRVALRSNGAAIGSGTMLEPGQRGVWHGGLVRVEQSADVRRELGWVDGQLSYDLVPLGDVLEDLTRWFNVRVVVPDSLAQVRVTVTLPADSVDVALRRLAAVLELQVERSGNDLRLTP